jgi:hypothetical protein
MIFQINKYHVFALAFFLGMQCYNFSQTKKIYVGINGKDSNIGLSIDNPLRTIKKAVEKAEAGDSVLILPGLYKEIINLISKNGKPERPIFIAGILDNKGDYPVIDGGAANPGMELTNYWITIDNSRWIEIEKLKFINGWTYPINLTNSSYVTFRDCKFFGARRVVSAEGENTHHILIEKCFWDQGGEFLWRLESDSQGVDAWTSMHHGNMMYFNGSIIDFSGTGGSIVIRENKIINAFNAVRWRGKKGCDSNIEIYDNDISRVRDNDFEPEIYTYNLHVYHNKSHNVHRTMSVDNVEGGNVYYYGNVITTDNDEWTKKVCTGFWKIYGGNVNRSLPMYAFNNSFYGVAKAARAEEEMVLFKHYNNAYFFTGDTAWYLNKWNATNEFDYDISNENWPGVFLKNNQEKHGKVTDIKFIDGSKKDLRLEPSSPGIDHGKIMFLPEFSWAQSFYGKAPDIGAYENDNLVEGPPFRFSIPQGSNITYKEKPRIVRHQVTRNKLILFFSDKLDTTVSKVNLISVWQKNKEADVSSVSFANNYEIIVETKEELSSEDLSVGFGNKIKGLNGEAATSWASTIKIKE